MTTNPEPTPVSAKPIQLYPVPLARDRFAMIGFPEGPLSHKDWQMLMAYLAIVKEALVTNVTTEGEQG